MQAKRKQSDNSQSEFLAIRRLRQDGARGVKITIPTYWLRVAGVGPTDPVEILVTLGKELVIRRAKN